jgi:hypothetical protein
VKTLTWRKRYEQIAWKRGRTKDDELAKLDLLQAAVAEFVALEEKNLLSTDEAQALANANRVLKMLTVSSADHLSEIGNSEIKALCDALDSRRTQARRRKGVAPGNKAKADEAAARKRICVKFYKKKCSGKKTHRQNLRSTAICETNGYLFAAKQILNPQLNPPLWAT